ncbi:MAG: translocation/assembly module TamB domain-containing protein [Undibacterium sp.]|nr:translocation/assembly module TamB domain-containing protein [Undibacterium sp.]
MPATSDQVPSQEKKGRTTWLRRFFYALALALFIFVLLLVFVLETAVGTRWFFQGLQNVIGTQFQVSGVMGNLAGEVTVAKLSIRRSDLQVEVDNLRMDSQAYAVITSLLTSIAKPIHRPQLVITSLQADTVKIMSLESSTSNQVPTNLQLPIDLDLRSVKLARLTVGKIAKPDQLQHFSTIVGSAKSNSAKHVIDLQFSSDWGTLQLDSQLETQPPFAIAGNFKYQGQNYPNLPRLLMAGTARGSLVALQLNASLSSEVMPTLLAATQEQRSQGQIQLELAPFKSVPINKVQAQFQHLDPQAIHKLAPHADLDVVIDLKQTSASIKENDLTGHLRLKNAASATWDRHGLPLRSGDGDVLWQDHILRLSNLNVIFPQGQMTGELKLYLPENGVPNVDAAVRLNGLNLAALDSRLHASEIKGGVQIQTAKNKRIDFQAQLKDDKFDSQLSSSAYFQFNKTGDSGSLYLEKLDFRFAQSRFSGSAEMNFENTQKFKLHGDIQEFNPGYWHSSLPQGSIAGILDLSGQLEPKLALKVNLPQLSGALFGQQLSGVVKAEWLQDSALNIEALDLQWGANTAHAFGTLTEQNKLGKQVQWEVNAGDLALLSKLSPMPISGKAKINGTLTGQPSALVLALNLQAQQLSLQGEPLGLAQWQTQELNVLADWRGGSQSSWNLSMQAQKNQVELRSANKLAVAENAVYYADSMKLELHGKPEAHQLTLQLQVDKKQQLQVAANGAWSEAGSAAWWGQITQFELKGFGAASDSVGPDLQLITPLRVQASAKQLSLGAAKMRGVLANLNLDSLDWTPRSLQSKGQITALRPLDLLKIVQPQQKVLAMQGDLSLAMDWDFQFKDKVSGEFNIQRQSGDLSLLGADGSKQAMGLNNLEAHVSSIRHLGGPNEAALQVKLAAAGARLGQWQARLETAVQRIDEHWTLSSEAPLKGEVQAHLPELQWLANRVSPDIAMKGNLDIDAIVSGKMSRPLYRAQIQGHQLELALAAEGLLFPNGELQAQLDQDSFQLQQLRFSNKITFIPKLELFQGLAWQGQEGDVTATGTVNWQTETGSIQAKWRQFPLLQRKDRWLVMSGESTVNQANQTWSLFGKLQADAAYFKLPKLPPPSLSDDVVVVDRRENKSESGANPEAKKPLKTQLDLEVDMGSRFAFEGRGIKTALVGALRLRNRDGAPVQASGTVATRGGEYEAYGQVLEIERGILNFQGAPNNPGLNVRALRKGLAVEAGVEVSGTFANPQVRLVSEPSVSEREKIAWLVLGHEPDQQGVDASLLLTAAGALFGGDGSQNIPKELMQGLGFDDFSIGPADNGNGSKLPSQTVAGATGVGSSSNDTVVKIGRRLRPGLVVAIEKGVSDASGALNLGWQLSNRVKLNARKSNDSSVDLKYSFSFN